jgi:hypothetical protein
MSSSTRRMRLQITGKLVGIWIDNDVARAAGVPAGTTEVRMTRARVLMEAQWLKNNPPTNLTLPAGTSGQEQSTGSAGFINTNQEAKATMKTNLLSEENDNQTEGNPASGSGAAEAAAAPPAETAGDATVKSDSEAPAGSVGGEAA